MVPHPIRESSHKLTNCCLFCAGFVVVISWAGNTVHWRHSSMMMESISSGQQQQQGPAPTTIEEIACPNCTYVQRIGNIKCDMCEYNFRAPTDGSDNAKKAVIIPDSPASAPSSATMASNSSSNNNNKGMKQDDAAQGKQAPDFSQWMDDEWNCRK